MRMGIDLGGTKIEGIVLDASGRECHRERIPTPQAHYKEILQVIHQLVSKLENQVACVCSIGIGTPGALNDAGLLKNSNTVVANGKPIKEDLQVLLGREIRMMNDANCFALSEATDGAGKGEPVVFGVIVGTGVGGGLVVHGRLLCGINHIAGEWGHNPLPWAFDEERPGSQCYCGKNGCIETFLSGPGMMQDYVQLTGRSLSTDAIVRAADKGEVQAMLVLRRYETRMARALAHIINILDPNVIVLGGGMSNIQSLYENVPRLWADYVFSDKVHTQLLPPVYGDSSGVRGAAWLWDA